MGCGVRHIVELRQDRPKSRMKEGLGCMRYIQLETAWREHAIWVLSGHRLTVTVTDEQKDRPTVVPRSGKDINLFYGDFLSGIILIIPLTQPSSINKCYYSYPLHALTLFLGHLQVVYTLHHTTSKL
jgi:hypothetical protein